MRPAARPLRRGRVRVLRLPGQITGQDGPIASGLQMAIASTVLGTTGTDPTEQPPGILETRPRGDGEIHVYTTVAGYGITNSGSPADQPGGLSIPPKVNPGCAFQFTDQAKCLADVLGGSGRTTGSRAPHVPCDRVGNGRPVAGPVERGRPAHPEPVAGRPSLRLARCCRHRGLRRLEPGAPPERLGRFYVPGHVVTRLAFDRRTGRLTRAARHVEAGAPGIIDIWDVSRPASPPEPAPGLNDPRLVASLAAPWDALHIAFDDAGTGLIYTWSNDPAAPGGVYVPVADPEFTFAGLYAGTQGRPPAPARPGRRPPTRDPVRRGDGDLRAARGADADQRHGGGEAENRLSDDSRVTAAFRLRVALPGMPGVGDVLTAKVQSLRYLPDPRTGRGRTSAAGSPSRRKRLAGAGRDRDAPPADAADSWAVPPTRRRRSRRRRGTTSGNRSRRSSSWRTRARNGSTPGATARSCRRRTATPTRRPSAGGASGPTT